MESTSHRRPLTHDVNSRDVAFVERNLASGREREVARGDLSAISLSQDGRSIVMQTVDSTTRSSTVVLIPAHAILASTEVVRTESNPQAGDSRLTGTYAAVLLLEAAIIALLWLLGRLF
jgi:hypothetical protein